MRALVDARDLFAVYPSATGGVAALQGLSLLGGQIYNIFLLRHRLYCSSTYSPPSLPPIPYPSKSPGQTTSVPSQKI